MTHSISIPRNTSQAVFDRACDIYSAVADVAKGEKRATAVLVDYFKSQPQDQLVARGRSLVTKAHQLPEPAQRLAGAVVHSVSCGLAQMSQNCAQARALIDKLCIQHDVKRCQEELERNFAQLGLGLTVQQAVDETLDAVRKSNAAVKAQLGEHAPDFAKPHIQTNLLAALRESGVLDEAVLDLLEMLPADKVGCALAAFTDEVSRLSDRLHMLENDLTRVRVAVGPGAQVRAFNHQEEQAYARLLSWTQAVHPGFHVCLQRLERIPEGVRAQVGTDQLEAFVTLAKRAALSVTQKSFKPKEMATLQAFRSTPAWQEIEPFARLLEAKSAAVIQHLSAPLIAVLLSTAQAHDVALADDGRLDISFCDSSAQNRGHEGNMEAYPFFDLGGQAADPLAIY